MNSIEQMVEIENNKELCVFKKAHCNMHDACDVCDGFNYNCESYSIQIKYVSLDDSD